MRMQELLLLVSTLRGPRGARGYQGREGPQGPAYPVTSGRFFDETALQNIYVSTTGSDTTGDGLQPTTAYATVNRALQDLPNGWTADVWINVAAGTYAGAQNWVLQSLPGARQTVVSSANTGRVSIMGDLTPVETLTGGAVGTLNAGTNCQYTHNVGAFATVVGNGTHWIRQADVGTNGFSLGARPVISGATPNVVVVNSVTTPLVDPVLMTWNTIFSGAINVTTPNFTGSPLSWFSCQAIRFGAASTFRGVAFRVCKFDLGNSFTDCNNVFYVWVSGTQTINGIVAALNSLSSGNKIAGSASIAGVMQSVSVCVWTGAPTLSAHLMMGGTLANTASVGLPGAVGSWSSNDFAGTGDAIWLRAGSSIQGSGGVGTAFLMSNGRPFLMNNGSRFSGNLVCTGTCGVATLLMNNSVLDMSTTYNVTNSVTPGQDIQVGELAVQAVAVRPTTSPVQLCRYS